MSTVPTTDSETTSLRASTLPDGRIIDGKNALQSFDVPILGRMDAPASTNGMKGMRTGSTNAADANRIDPVVSAESYDYSNSNGTMSNNDVNSIRAQAVPAQSFLTAEGYMLDSRLPTTTTSPPPLQEGNQRSKKSLMYWLVIVLVILLVAVAAGIGGYCGGGHCSDKNRTIADIRCNCKSSRIDNYTVSCYCGNRGSNSFFIDNITSFDKSGADQTIVVAFNFLNLTNLDECQATKGFGGLTVGKTIPSEIGVLTQLTFFSFLYAGLTNTIPSTLGKLVQLTSLTLSENQLTGTIPLQLGNLVQLNRLSMINNDLSGTIPSNLRNLYLLETLNLFNNSRLSGTVSVALCAIDGIEIGIHNVECSCCSDGFPDLSLACT